MAGNIQLAIEVQAIRTVNALIEHNALTQEFLDRYPLKPVRLRIISIGDEVGATLDYASKLDRNPSHILGLMEEGEKQATRFLKNPEHTQFDPPDWWAREEGISQLVK